MTIEHAKDETAWLIELRGAHPPWYWHAEPDPRLIGGFDPDVNKAMRFCREKDARAMALMLGAKGMIAITDVRHIEISEHAWTKTSFDTACDACGHADQYHFDDGHGNIVCRATRDCACVHRAESKLTPPIEAYSVGAHNAFGQAAEMAEVALATAAPAPAYPGSTIDSEDVPENPREVPQAVFDPSCTCHEFGGYGKCLVHPTAETGAEPQWHSEGSKVLGEMAEAHGVKPATNSEPDPVCPECGWYLKGDYCERCEKSFASKTGADHER